MIKVVLWDIDGTILDFIAAEKVAIRKCFCILGLGECTDEMLEQYSKINVRYWQMLEKGEMTKRDILVGRFREFFEKNGLDVTKAEAFNSEYQVRLGDTICFNEGALETVKSLAGRVVQAVVTNGTKIAQDRKLSESGLYDIMDYAFISEEIGIEKPGVEFFDRVFDKIGSFKKDEVIIVGDSLTSDIKGGNNAGIITCWYNPEMKKDSYGMKIDHEIRRISEVIGIIDKYDDVN